MTLPPDVERLLRRVAPEVLGALLRRHGSFNACEDAVQEALIAATVQWPRDGIPDDPRAWLLTVASRRLVDEVRAELTRRRREETVLLESAADASDAALRASPSHDDSLALLFLCCHESLTPPSQIALTLRAVGGLTTAEIAKAFLVPEATMAQRISRAKSTVRSAGATFELPDNAATDERLTSVLHVLYLIFNEGYTAGAGAQIQRLSLAEEAIRLARMLARLLPDDDEVRGLLALMLLTHARRQSRTDHDGALVPLSDQDRSRWDREAIAEGMALVSSALAAGPVGPYQLQAAISAAHADAPSSDQTDWREITALYEMLEGIAPNPIFTLNRAVAVAMFRGPEAGLDVLETIASDERFAGNHRLPAVRGHLLEMAGDLAGAAADYEAGARLTTSLPERDYLRRCAATAVDRSVLERRRAGSAAVGNFSHRAGEGPGAQAPGGIAPRERHDLEEP